MNEQFSSYEACKTIRIASGEYAKVPTKWVGYKLTTGAEVHVGHQPVRPDGEGYIVKLIGPPVEGQKRTMLEFGISPSACIALALAFAHHKVKGLTMTTTRTGTRMTK